MNWDDDLPRGFGTLPRGFGTLPRGFGSGYDNTEKEPERKDCVCNFWQKSIFGIGYSKDSRGQDHSESYGDAHIPRKVAVSALIMIGFLTCIIIPVGILNGIEKAETLAEIENLNCKQLAEYIAFNYGNNIAEHRYEWLCVNEQIKEFQG